MNVHNLPSTLKRIEFREFISLFHKNKVTLSVSDRIYLEFYKKTLSVMVVGVLRKYGHQTVLSTELSKYKELSSKDTFPHYKLISTNYVGTDTPRNEACISNLYDGRKLSCIAFMNEPNNTGTQTPFTVSIRLIGTQQGFYITGEQTNELTDQQGLHTSNSSPTDLDINPAYIEYNNKSQLVTLELTPQANKPSLINLTNIHEIDWYQPCNKAHNIAFITGLKEFNGVYLSNLINTIIAKETYLNLSDLGSRLNKRTLIGVTTPSLYIILSTQQLKQSISLTAMRYLLSRQLIGLVITEDPLHTEQELTTVSRLYYIVPHIEKGKQVLCVYRKQAEETEHSAFESCLAWYGTVPTSIQTNEYPTDSALRSATTHILQVIEYGRMSTRKYTELIDKGILFCKEEEPQRERLIVNI